MIYFIFTAVLLIFLYVLSVIMIKKWIKNQENRIVSLAKSYLESHDGEPSEFSKFVDLASKTLASRIMQAARAQLMNMSSIASRQTSAIENAVISDIAGQASPVLGMALDSFPKLAKLVQKNPQLLTLVQSLGQGLFKNNAAGSSATKNIDQPVENKSMSSY